MDIHIIDEKNTKNISDSETETSTEESYHQQIFRAAREAGFEIFTKSGLKSFVRDKVWKYKIKVEEWLLKWSTHLYVHLFWKGM